MAFVDMKRLLERDREWKGGSDFDTESANLTMIYRGRANKLTKQWLKQMGQGDRKSPKPLQTKILKRLIRTSAVIWQNHWTRTLMIDGAPLPDADSQALEVSDIYRRSRFNATMKQADRWSTLLGQAVIYHSPNFHRERVQARIFQPHHVARDPDDSNADDITTDNAVAFRVHIGSDEDESIWHYWIRGLDGWEAFRVYQTGELVTDRDELFPDGRPPFEETPFLQIYDEDPSGQAWLPIDETRTAFVMAQNLSLNDIMYLLKQEAHTGLAVTGLGAGGVRDLPKSWGPGELWGFEEPETQVQPIALNPKLLESIGVSRHILEMLAAGEGLPADYFLASRKYETGAAGRLRQQDLDLRRMDQLEGAVTVESESFEAIRSIHNAYAAEWGREMIEEGAELQVEPGEPWFPLDLPELQKTSLVNLSVGAESVIDYLMKLKRIPRDRALALYRRIQVDREAFPVRENPAALVGGPNAALGRGSAQRGEGPGVEPDSSTINPNRAGATEGASHLDAARSALGDAEQFDDADPTELGDDDLAPSPKGVDSAQDTALNGAQVESAVKIVLRVSEGLLPREAGLGMLEVFFNLSRKRAEKIMGEVGAGFRPAPPRSADPPLN